MRTAADLEAYRRAGLLPRQLLHPAIAGKVVALFIRGDYDTAVFQAFKEVEVAVRVKGKFAETDVGTKLMRKAFDKDTGPLRDPNAEDPGEREAMAISSREPSGTRRTHRATGTFRLRTRPRLSSCS